MEKVKGLWKLPVGRDWLRGKWVCSDGWVMICKPPIFCWRVDCVPSLLFGLRPNCGGGNEDNGELLQRSHALLHSVPQACSRPLLTHAFTKIPGHSQESLVHSLMRSLLLSPGSWCTQVLFVPSKCLFLQPCVGSGSSIVGLMVASSKRAYPLPRSTAPRAPVPAAVHCWPMPPEETLRHSSVSASVGSLGPGAHKICLSSLSISGGYGAWF